MNTRIGKRLLSLMLVGCLCVSLLPGAGVLATDTEETVEPDSYINDTSADAVDAPAEDAEAVTEEEDYTAPVSYADVESGTCGDNLTWVLEDGVLTISGTGEIPAWEFSNNGMGMTYETDKTITSVIIKDGVTSIGEYAFYRCTDLTSVSIPDSMTSIGDCAFYSCTSLASVTIPDSVTSIGGSAFYDCIGLTSAGPIGGGYSYEFGWTESIPGWAFGGCTGLTSMSIPDSMTSIGDCAFYNCTSLASVTIPNSVTSIGGSAFSGCTGLISVSIPDSVTSIGDYAFEGCIGLASVSIPDSVTTIGSWAFQFCTGLTSVTIPDSVTSIGGGAFSGCTSLTSVTIPDSVTSIGGSAFYGCTGLTSVSIGSNVTSIGDTAFGACTSLTSVSIPDSVTSIGSCAFSVCIGLTNVSIPDSVTSIGDGAFSGCTGLTSVSIPNSVTSIGAYAFSDCTSLESAYILAANVVFGSSVFADCADGFTIYGIASNTAEQYAEGNDIPFVPISVSRTLTVTVYTPDGSQITDGFTAVWYDAEGNAIAEGTSLAGADMEESYTVEVTLDSGLAALYTQPEACVITSTDGAVCVVTLSEISILTLTGRVTTQDGAALSGAAVTVTHNTLDTTYTAQTDADGYYSLSVPCASLTVWFQMDDYYSHSETLDLSDETSDTYDFGTCALTAVVTDRITLAITAVSAVTEGSAAVQKTLSSAGTLNIALTDETGAAVTGFEVQGTTILFQPNVAAAGATYTVSVSDPTGTYADAASASVTLNDNRVGSAEITLTEKGGFTMGGLTGPDAVMTVYNSVGTNVLSESAAGGKTYSGMDAGEYTVILIEKNSLIRTAPSVAYLSALGLTAGTDYLSISVTVEDGITAALDDCTVPLLDTDKLAYVIADDTSVSISKTGSMTVGASFYLRVAYQVDASKGVDAESVQVVFPEGVSPADGVTAFVDNTVTAYAYDSSTRTVTMNVSGRESAVVYLYGQAENTAGSYDIGVYLGMSGGILQPLGSATATVEVSSLSAPERTSSDTITVSGTTAPNSTVTLYDNDTQVAVTTSNHAGSWSASVPLAGKLYTYSCHYIHAEIESDLFEGTAVSTETLVVYDETYMGNTIITMYNYGHEDQATVFDLSDTSTIVPYYNYNPDNPTFTFKVEIESGNSTYIETLYVCTTDSSGDVTYVTLTYDETLDAWYGTHDYTYEEAPVKVGVAYDVTEEYYTIPEDEEWLADVEEEIEKYTNAVLDVVNELVSTYVTVNFDSDSGTGEIIYTPVDSETGEPTGDAEVIAEFEITSSELPEETTIEDLVADYYDVDDTENVAVRIGVTDVGSFVVEIADIETEVTETVKLTLTDAKSTNKTGDNDNNNGDGENSEEKNNRTNSSGSGSISWFDWISDNFDTEYLAANALSMFAGISGKITFGGDVAASCMSVYSNGNKLQQGMNAYIDGWMNQMKIIDEELNAKCTSTQQLKVVDEFNYARSEREAIYRNIEESLKMYEQFYYADRVFEGVATIAVLGITGILTAAVTVGTVGFGTAAAIAGTTFLLNAHVNHCSKKLADGCLRCLDNYAIQNRISNLKDFIRSNYICDDDDSLPIPDGQTGNKQVVGILDPSGYVYEAVPSNRLEGVTATISYRDGEDSVVWDAEEYDQVNPQVTGSDGIYHWDVPIGDWKVTFSKDGYYAADTSGVSAADEDGWMPVPPPQMDINVGMISTDAPTVESAVAYTDRIEVVFSQYMDIESVQNTLALTRDGETVAVTVDALDAEYNLEETVQYATRFSIVPLDGEMSGELLVTAADTENYAGTALVSAWTSDTLTAEIRPTAIVASDSVEAVIHEKTLFSVVFLPGVSGQTLMVESQTENLVTVSTASVVTDETGTATVEIIGKLPGSGSVIISDSVSGVSKTVEVNVVLTTSSDEESIQPVSAYLSDGTALTTGMEIPYGSEITLITTTQNATIRYTLNDTCPCKEEALYYTGPIVLTADTVLRAAAAVDGEYSATIRLELAVTEGSNTSTPGDLNGDGEVDAGDLTILARHVGKVEYITDKTALANADVTGDGNVDASDLTKLAQYVGKIISSLD